MDQELKQPEKAKNFKKKYKKKKRNRHHVRKVIARIFAIAILLAAVAGAGAYAYYLTLLDGVPELDLSKRDEYSMAATLYDGNGQFFASYGCNENIDWVPISEIPQNMQDAIVSIEDKRFYEHNGIDIKRLTGAVIGQLTGTADYGASTITQQLIKNNYLSPEVTYKRKAQEIHLALQLEKKMSKQDILEWYLNTVFFGNNDYGIKNAAYDFFGVTDLNDLTLRECAMLAGLVQSPTTYNPMLNTVNGTMDVTNNRTDTVLYAMHENGRINDAEYRQALDERPEIRTESDITPLYNDPVFVDYCIENVAQKLLEQNGVDVTDETMAAEKKFLRGSGYEIHMTLKPDIQEALQSAITNYKNYPKTYTGEEVEASAVIMDQHNGQVIAMVGGREVPTQADGFNRATDSTQAVGSSIKPLSVYAPAIELGDYPGTTVLDAKTKIEGYNTEQGYPGGDTINAEITMRRALELSHNIPAVRFLLERVGLDRSFNYMVEEGFSPEHLSKTAAGLGLGATDVTTLEMTGAYATLANGGVYIEPHAYTSVNDRNGNVILNGNSEIDTRRVFRESTAWLVTDMMQGNVEHALGVNARLSGMTACGKTGTHEHQALSFGGYTYYYTSFLRISADSYTKMSNSSSYRQAAPLWRSYMEPIHSGLEDVPIMDASAEDLGIQKYKVCANTGMLAASECPSAYEYAAPENAPYDVCDGNHTYGITEPSYSYYEETGDYPGYWDDYGNWIGQGWWDENGYHWQ